MYYHYSEYLMLLNELFSLYVNYLKILAKNTEKSKPQGKPKAGLTQEQVRMKNLREAFNFYSK